MILGTDVSFYQSMVEAGKPPRYIDFQKTKDVGVIADKKRTATVNGEFGIGSLARDDLFCSFQSAWHLTCHCSCSFYLSILETNSPQFQLTYL